MSSKHDDRPVESSERNAHDFYPTPPEVAWAVTQRLSLIYPNPDYLIEPSAGNGNFVRAAKAAWPGRQVHAIELRGEERQNCINQGADSFTEGDWPTIVSAWQPQGRPLVLGNPPFAPAASHILAGLDHLLPGSAIAFYLKMNFIGGEDRAETLWTQGQWRYLIPVLGRPSFKKTAKSKHDFNEYGVYVWEVGYTGRPEVLLPHIRWKAKRVRAAPRKRTSRRGQARIAA